MDRNEQAHLCNNSDKSPKWPQAKHSNKSNAANKKRTNPSQRANKISMQNHHIDQEAKFGANATGNGAATPSAHRPQSAPMCAGCSRPIKERFLLEALGSKWHEDCLKCACCDCRLGEVGSSLFTHSDKILCRRDFLRIFGQHGSCAICGRSIPPYELVMKAKQKAYHIECFSCQSCQYRFCVGDKFHLTDEHKIVCLFCHSDGQQQQQQQPQPQQQASKHQQQQQQQQHQATSPQKHPAKVELCASG